MMDKMAELSEEHGGTGHATINYDGDTSGYYKQSVGIKTGVTATAHFQFNSQTAANSSSAD